MTTIILTAGQERHGEQLGSEWEVVYWGFGYVEACNAKRTAIRVKDTEFVYKHAVQYAHINDLRDLREAGCYFDNDGNLCYNDGRIALKASNLYVLNKTYKILEWNTNQIIIGSDARRICFNRSEIGLLLELK